MISLQMKVFICEKINFVCEIFNFVCEKINIFSFIFMYHFGHWYVYYIRKRNWKGKWKMKTFVKRIDENEEVQVVTIDEQGHVYVDIMDIDEFNQVYRYENYFIA